MYLAVGVVPVLAGGLSWACGLPGGLGSALPTGDPAPPVVSWGASVVAGCVAGTTQGSIE